MNKKWIAGTLAGLALAGTLAALATSPADAGEKAAAADHAALTVATVKPASLDWPLTVTTSGGIYPWQEAVVAAETGGLKITALHADVGTQVKRGQVLAELARDTVDAEVAERQAQVAQAKAALSEAKANAARARTLQGSGALSDQQINQYLVAEETAAANLAAAEALLKSSRIRLAQTRIAAVDDGVVSSRTATLGSVVQAGSELFRLVRKNRLEWRAEVTADQLASIHPGQEAQLRLADGQTIDGKVRLGAPTFDTGSRKALVYIDLPPAAKVRAGQFATGTIEIGDRKAVTLPQSAVVLRDGNDYVLEVKPDHRVAQRKVATGRRRGDRVEIVSGLAADAAVVEKGGAFLHDGDTVRLEATSAGGTQNGATTAGGAKS